jgi:CRP-like cAMP-binding protein
MDTLPTIPETPRTKRRYAERTYRTYKYRLGYKGEDGETVFRLFMNREDIAQFVGVSPITVCRWLNGRTAMKTLQKYTLERVRIPAKVHVERTCVE